MNLQDLRSQFTFHQSERVGILLLLAVIIGLLFINFFVSFSEEDTFDLCSPELAGIQEQIDSLRLAELEQPPPKIYPFNPNFLTDYRAYTLGISAEAVDKLRSFREEGRWVNSAADFQRITGIPDSVLERVKIYFKFPEWANRPKSRRTPFRKEAKLLSAKEKRDLNTATSEELQSIYGIGPALGERIVTQRERLQGFAVDKELNTVFGLKPEVIENILREFIVKEPRDFKKMNVNTASASDLSTLPGFSFETGKEIWQFVRVREGINDLSELLKIEEITPQRFKLIELYLYAE